MRTRAQKYPDFTAEIEAIERGGITDELLNKIIDKHSQNAARSKELMARYEALADGVPIFQREPRFATSQEEKREIINHRINNDFFSEIIDFKVGYFAGNPVAYSYSNTEEALDDTADTGDTLDEAKAARDAASKKITDFVVRSNMFDVNMETTKFASMCGYAGRLFYIDPDGEERCMVTPPDESIILSKTKDITHPTYGVRYYSVTDMNQVESLKAEFYDANMIYYAEGARGALHITHVEPNLFGMCPLQGIPNNREMLGDAEKVLALIDAYDRALSDINNEVDSFANAYMVFENVELNEEEMRKMQASGAFSFYTGGANGGKVYFLTKEINDAFLEHHLDRLEDNIRLFSKTPDMSDEAFGTASGVALKFKLTGLETKCGMFEAKVISADTYMFELLSKAWEKKQVKVDPLLCVSSFKRNFPLDLLSEAQAVQALIAAGLPQRVAYEVGLSCVDDVESVMQEIEMEKYGLPSLRDESPEDGDETEFTTEEREDGE